MTKTKKSNTEETSNVHGNNQLSPPPRRKNWHRKETIYGVFISN